MNADNDTMESHINELKHSAASRELAIRCKLGRRGHSGFTIIELLIGIGVTGVLLLAAVSSFSMFAQSAQSVKTNQSLIEFKGQLVREILNPVSLGATVSDSNNISMLCLRQGTDCYGKTGSAFRLDDMRGKIVYDSSDPGAGFNQNGGLCSGYSATTPNSECPYRYDLTWKPLCSASPCINPPIQISGVFKTALPTTGGIRSVNKNSARLDILVTTNVKAGSPFAPSKVYFVNYNTTSNLPILASAWSGQFGGALTATITVPPTHGTASISLGMLTLTPTPGYHGLDSVSYRVTNSMGKSTEATASLKVMTPYTWTGDGTDSTWSNNSNWCLTVKSDFSACTDGVVPDTASWAVFDETCSANCNANMMSSVSIAGFIMDTGYNGTVNQVAGDWIVGATGVVINSGKLVADSAFNTTINGPFLYNGGVFECWSPTYTGTLTLNGDVTINTWGLEPFRPVVLTNSGAPTTVKGLIYAVGFSDFTVAGTDTITILGNITTAGTAKFNKSGGDLIGGGFTFYGDAIVQSLPGTNGTTYFRMSGSQGHTLTGIAGNIPNLYVNSFFSLFPFPFNTQVLAGNIHVLHTATLVALSSPVQGQDPSTKLTVDETLDLQGTTYTKNGSVLIVGGVVQGTGIMYNGSVAP